MLHCSLLKRILESIESPHPGGIAVIAQDVIEHLPHGCDARAARNHACEDMQGPGVEHEWFRV